MHMQAAEHFAGVGMHMDKRLKALSSRQELFPNDSERNIISVEDLGRASVNPIGLPAW